MKIWIFVEGVSDKNALTALWDEWRLKLREYNWDYRLVVLRGKPKYMKKIGHSAAQKLIESENDLVIGLPDLYPTRDFKDKKRWITGLQ